MAITNHSLSTTALIILAILPGYKSAKFQSTDNILGYTYDGDPVIAPGTLDDRRLDNCHGFRQEDGTYFHVAVADRYPYVSSCNASCGTDCGCGWGMLDVNSLPYESLSYQQPQALAARLLVDHFLSHSAVYPNSANILPLIKPSAQAPSVIKPSTQAPQVENVKSGDNYKKETPTAADDMDSILSHLSDKEKFVANSVREEKATKSFDKEAKTLSPSDKKKKDKKKTKSNSKKDNKKDSKKGVKSDKKSNKKKEEKNKDDKKNNIPILSMDQLKDKLKPYMRKDKRN